jgi:hypothetical protein
VPKQIELGQDRDAQDYRRHDRMAAGVAALFVIGGFAIEAAGVWSLTDQPTVTDVVIIEPAANLYGHAKSVVHDAAVSLAEHTD